MNQAVNHTDIWTVVTIIGLALVTVVTRSFFFFSSKPWHLSAWAERGSQGELISTFKDARLYAIAAGALWFYWRKGVLGTIVVGMAVYLPLHIGLRW